MLFRSNTPRKGQHLSLSSSEHENYYRHRFLFLNYLQDYDKFPNIHIQPIKDGSLLTVIRYIVDKVYKNSFSINPFDFIEEISVGNFCKYSIRSIKNIDYAQNYKRLSESIEFIISDLRLIKPDLIILPKTIFNTIDKKYSYNWDYIIKQSELKKPLRIVRIYQTNSQVINTHISKDPKSHLDSTSVESFCSKWPIRKSIKGLKLYLNWLDQNWDDLTLVKQ